MVPYPLSPAHQQGAISVAFILFAVLLLGFVGVAADVGRLYISKAELQNAADSCALAASAALTGANADQLIVAENFAITAGTRNLMGMQAGAVAIPPDAAVTFSDTLDGVYRTKDTIPAGEVAAMRFARCTLSETGIGQFLIQVLNALPGNSIGSQTVQATAVATLAPSISNCAIPLGICEKGPAPTYGLTQGEWLQGRLEPGGGIDGAFKWLRFPGFERTPNLAALMSGAGQCDLNTSGTVQSHAGVIDSLLTAWNTRLGIYRPGGPTIAEAPPDFSGWVYDPTTWPAQANAFDDFASRRASNAFGNVPLPNPNNWAAATDFASFGSDRRLVVGPIINCAALGSNGTTAILDWACWLMLNPVYNPGDFMWLEYRGLANSIGSGCVSSGLPGGPAAGGPQVPALVQ